MFYFPRQMCIPKVCMNFELEEYTNIPLNLKQAYEKVRFGSPIKFIHCLLRKLQTLINQVHVH